ncbi:MULTISPECIES: MFS transporter [unclassified Acinetobacter]|uniref:MFS transporter n=1 Tax=unclassified Acinetobacter TaxID=196816 RepID=UPI0029343E0A|nr:MULTISPECIES: MFS transporter [unclassified Acinetobacter]WOE32038.1 MFS transporter [Acinetobacter sp. SAAs470]WOE37507.1 MFS transporter [Acinetobacter sp. SAAs474]
MIRNNIYDSKMHLFAIFIFSAITPLVLMAAPVLAQQLAKQWLLTPSQVGLFFFIELGFMSCATLPGFIWTKKINFQKAAQYFAILFFIGNLLSILATSFEMLLIGRAISALGGGSLMIVTITSCSYTKNPDRAYSYWMLGQVMLGAIALYCFPQLFNYWGLNTCFIVMLVAIVLAFPLHKYFANYLVEKKIAVQVSVAKKSGLGIFAIIATLLFYGAIGGVWTFMSSIGEHANIDSHMINSVLAISTLIGISGSFIATFVSGRINRLYLILVGYGLFFLSLCLLLDNISKIFLVVSILLFKFTWMFSAPFVLATVASLDQSGKLINFTNLVIGGGLAFGPMLAGQLIENTGNYHMLILYTLMVFLCSFIIVFYCNMQKQQREQAVVVKNIKV